MPLGLRRISVSPFGCTHILAFAVSVLVGVHHATAQDWTRGHGGADNAGFADVNTTAITAGTPHTTAANLGAPAPGTGIVIAQNNVAYFGTMDGQLTGIRDDGTTVATVHVPEGHILASPLIGSDGSIYVAASLGTPVDTHDRRTIRAWLYRFTPRLKQVWQRPLPVHDQETGAALAINAMGSGAGEIIAVAAAEKVSAGFRVILAGFAPDGTALFNADVGGSPNDVQSGSLTDLQKILCWPFANPCHGEADAARGHDGPDNLPPDIAIKPVGIAIADGNVMVVADGFNGVRGYRYTPGAGLSKVFEKFDGRHLTSAPAVLPNGRSVYGVEDGRIAFSGPASEHVADIYQLDGNPAHRWAVEATPTRLANGNIVTVDHYGNVTVVNNGAAVAHTAGAAESVAGASASRDTFYVTTASALQSFDAATNAPTGSFPWTDGGQVPVAIGDTGRVYAFAGGTLYIFSAGKPVNVAGRPTRIRPARLRKPPPETPPGNAPTPDAAS